MEEINCNLCSADDPQLIGVVHDIAFDIPGEFPLVRCRRCGLIYLKERPTPEEIGNYYPSSYKPYRQALEDERYFLIRWARKRNIRKRRKVIEKYCPQIPGRILDVGCSTGIFLNEMHQAGWKTKGVEINQAAANYARQRFGLEVDNGTLLDTKFHPKSFKAITFWDVIEHTYNPLKTLQYTNYLLEDNGIVALTIPHWNSLDRTLFGMEWIGFDAPRHLYVFPQNTLQDMLEQAGFRFLKAWSGLGGYYTFLASLRLWLRLHLPKQGRTIMNILEVPGIRFFFQPFFSVNDWLGIGGTLVVIALKTNHLDDYEKKSNQ